MCYAARRDAKMRWQTAMDGYIAWICHCMMNRIARAVRHGTPTDAIAML